MIDLCEFCGACSTRYCEIEDEENGIECPQLEILERRNSDLNAAIDTHVKADSTEEMDQPHE